LSQRNRITNTKPQTTCHWTLGPGGNGYVRLPPHGMWPRGTWTLIACDLAGLELSPNLTLATVIVVVVILATTTNITTTTTFVNETSCPTGELY